MTDEELEKLAAASEDDFRHRAANHSDFRYDKQQDNFWDIGTDMLISARAVNASIPMMDWETTGGDDPKPIAPAKTIASIDTGLVVECSTWWPGKPKFIRDYVINEKGAIPLKGGTTFNTYRAPDFENMRTDRDPDLWINHVKKLYPDPAEHEHFFDFAAHCIQKPAQKPQHGVLLAGQQGIGKDALLRPIRWGVGPGNAAAIDPDELFTGYNGYAKSVLLVIDEVKPHPNAGKASDFYNKLKPLMANTGETVGVIVKFANAVYIPNVTRVIMTTNDPLKMYIPPEDRRIFVMTSRLPDPKINDVFEEDYFERLFTWMDDGGTHAVVRWLNARDISGFKHGKAPPVTAGRKAIIESAQASRRSMADEVFELFIEKAMGGEEPDVIFPQDLSQFISSGSGLFDDVEEGLKAIRARNFHYKMGERGYELLRNPDANRWKRGAFASRLAFVKRDIELGKRVSKVQAALADRPLRMNVEKAFDKKKEMF